MFCFFGILYFTLTQSKSEKCLVRLRRSGRTDWAALFVFRNLFISMEKTSRKMTLKESRQFNRDFMKAILIIVAILLGLHMIAIALLNYL
jgi:hypothetical protein